MIARTWHGLTPLETKTAFRKYLEQTGVRDALALPGNRGAFVSVVDQGAYAHFFLCTFWESREDLLAYAGDNPSLAVTYPEDAAFGLISDPIVIHQEVPEARNPFAEGGPGQNLLESASGQRENPTLEAVAETLRAVRQTSPLVHFITNYVTVNDCANITLAAGASPIMADDAREAGQITGLCSALVLNMGTPNERTVQAMLHAGQAANLLGRPVVFDPVGAGASDFRNDTALRLLREVRCAAIKGNSSEISFLAGGMADARGVDAGLESLVTEDNLAENARRAQKMAALTGAVIMVTGPIDIVADSREVWAVRNGHAMMARITGTGCMSAAVTGAYLGANPRAPLRACVCAMAAMGVCGELAYEKLRAVGGGTGSYRIFLLDAMSELDAKTLAARARVERLEV